MRGRHIERKVVEAIRVRAPDERADAFEHRREDHEPNDLDLDRARLKGERDDEKGPRQNGERGLLRETARPIERQPDRDQPNKREEERERAAGRHH